MMRIQNPFRGIKLVRRHSSPVTKAAVLAAVVLSTVALVVLHGSIQNNRSQYEAMRLKAVMLEGENEKLTSRIENVGTVEGIELIAREELGLEFPDTIVFTPDN